jgi:anti-sigma regulatory factor (Ser/Thr protein kinase)
MEVTATDEVFELAHEADVGALRRRGAVLAAAAGLDEARAGAVALIATELASNVIKHGGGGGALLAQLPGGVAITAWDRGPGMNVDACLRDGMSTAGTAGVGLGAVARLATRWDAYAPAGRGTVVTARVTPAVAASGFEIGGVCVPYPGLDVCGDGWRVHVHDLRATVIAVDGLGHGDGAAEATAAVLAAIARAPHDPPVALLDRANQAARATRGAAATVVQLDLAAQTAVVAGVGNVAAWIHAGGAQRQLVTQHGTLGHAAPRLREETYPFPSDAVLLVASDGLKSRLVLDDFPGLLAREPRVVASVLWRDCARGRDDASTVVVRAARPQR